MTMSSWNGAVVAATRAARAGGRNAALAALLGASLLLGPVHVHAAEKGAKQAAAPVKVSPYLRYAREHAKTAAKVPARGRPSSSSVHGARGGARLGSH
jgi:hypothetical protein